MAKLNTGLKTFGIQTATSPLDSDEAQPSSTNTHQQERNPRGHSDVVYVGVRLKRQDWNRLHEHARGRGKSLQKLIEEGLSRLLQDEGFPPISRWYEK